MAATFYRMQVGSTPIRLAESGNWHKAIVSVEVADLRYRVDGGLPEASYGHLIYNSGTMHLTSGEEIRQCYLVAATGTPGIVCVTLE